MKKLIVILLVAIPGLIVAQGEESKPVGRPDLPGDLFIDIGINFLNNYPPLMEINPWTSRTVNLYYQYDIKLGDSHFRVSPGLGIGNDKFGFRNPVSLQQGDNGVELYELRDVYPTGEIRKTQVAVTYFDVPLDFWFYANKYDKRGFKIGLGGKGGVRIDSKTKVVIREDGNNFKYKQKESYGLNPFRYAAHVKIGYGVFYLWGMYNFAPVFEAGRAAPELGEPNNWTVGISIAGF